MRNPLRPGPDRWLAIWQGDSKSWRLVIDWLPWHMPLSGRMVIGWRRDPWRTFTQRNVHHTPVRRIGPLRVVVWPLRRNR